MEQNNTQTEAPKANANVQVPNATVQPNRVKSYTERFQEMEMQLITLTQLYTEANQAFGISASIIQDLASQNRMQNDQLQALYDLLEPLGITRTMVTDKINDRRVKKVTDLLDKDEAAGIIKKIDAVESDDNIIVYESDEISLAFKAVAAFEQDGIKNELTGKKAGDTVGKMTIKSVYKIVELQNTEGQSNEQE